MPLVGYLPFLSSWDPQYPHRALQKMSEVYGPVTGFYLGLSTMISVCSHEAVKEAMLNENLNGRPHSSITLARNFGENLGNLITKKKINPNSLLSLFFLPGIMFIMGQFWQEQRRFTMRHLRDLGFGKTSIEDQMMGEVGDLIKDIENKSQSDKDRVVNLKGIFQVSVVNILWAIIAGICRFLKITRLLTNTYLILKRRAFPSRRSQIPGTPNG